jgi:hypothetical protein
MGNEKGVLLIETITKIEELEEIESLFHVLKMTDFPPEKVQITGKESKEKFILQFTKKNPKKGYIHISSHGDKDGFYIHGNRETTVTINDFLEYEDELEGAMKGRFLTISACGSLSNEFFNKLHKLLQFEAVISPANEVNFDESAIFFINFYFNLSKIYRSARKEVRLVDFIDTFQKTKIGYLLQGGSGGMRLLYNNGNRGKLETIF